MNRRVLFGAIAAVFGASVALDSVLGTQTHWPVWHRLFPADDDWQIARNMFYSVCSIGAAFFGYLALNVKNGAPNG